MDKMRVGVTGCAGRMGRTLLQVLAAEPACEIAGGTDMPGSAAVGQDLGRLAGLEPLGTAVTDDPVDFFASVEGVIDFTTPAATLAHTELAAQARVPLVIGTTGLDAQQQAAIERAARHTAIVQAANMSLGVNLLLALVEQVAASLGDDYDIEILDMHHRHKVDAPSGTALALGAAAAAGRGVALDSVAERGRDGITEPRAAGAIGFAVLRGGDVAGDHSVIFAGEGERLELTHKASSREVFARGAVRALLWARGRSPGLYGMRDVLGLEEKG